MGIRSQEEQFCQSVPISPRQLQALHNHFSRPEQFSKESTRIVRKNVPPETEKGERSTSGEDYFFYWKCLRKFMSFQLQNLWLEMHMYRIYAALDKELTN